MADVETSPAVRIPFEADLTRYARQAEEAEHIAERTGGKAGRGFQKAFGDGLSGRDLKAQVEKLTRDIERTFELSMADAKESLARKLIDEKEFAKQGKEAADAFDSALLKTIERLAKTGPIADPLFVSLTDKLKLAGVKGGQEFTEGAKGGLGDLAGWIKGAFAAGITTAIFGMFRRIISGLRNVAREAKQILAFGGEVDRLQGGFEQQASGVGLDPSETMRQLRESSRGLVSNFELMRRANAAFRTELPVTTKSLGELVEISRRLAKVTGDDATDAFRRLVEGIAKGEPEILDELGLTTRLTDALKTWELQTGKNASTLGQQAKTVIFYNAVLAEARKKVAGMGAETLDAGERVAQLGVAWDNLKSSTAQAIANSPKIATFLDSMGDSAAASADRVQGLAMRIGALVDTFADLSTSGPVQGTLETWERAFTRQGKVVGLIARGLGFNADTGQARELFQQHLRERELAESRQQEIRDETNSAALLLRKMQTLTRIAHLEASGSEQHAQEIRMLEQEVDLINRQRLLLAGGRHGGDDPPVGLTEEELRKVENARKAIEERIRAYQALAPLREMGIATNTGPDTMEARLQRIYEIDQEVREIEAQVAAARGTAPAAIQQIIASLQREKAAIQENVTAVKNQWDNLPEVQTRLAQIVTTIGQMSGGAVSAGGGRWTTITEGLNGITRATKEVQAAQAELTRAQLSGDTDRVAAALKRQEVAQRAVRTATAAATKLFEDGVSQGAITQEQLNDLIAQMVELLKQAGIQVTDITEKGRDWQDLAQQAAGVARGVLSVADALGAVDDQSRRALQGVVDVAEAAGRIAANPADIGAWAQGIGGAIGFAQGVLGGDPRELEKQRRAMVDLSKALLALRDAYLGNVSSEQLQSDKEFAGRARETWEKSHFDIKMFGDRDWVVKDIAVQLGAAGKDASKADAAAALERRLGELDQRYGTSLVSLLQDKDLKGLLEQLERLPDAIQDQIDKLGSFGNSVEDVIAKVAFQFQVLGDTDAAEQLAAVNAALKAAGKSAGAFQSQFDELAGLNLDTEAGRSRRDEIVRAMMESLNAGGANTGSLTVDQLRDLILQYAEAVGNPGSGVTAGGAAEMRMNVSMTEIQSGVLLTLTLGDLQAGAAPTSTPLLGGL